MKKINLSLLSTLVLFTGLATAEAAHQNHCADQNKPIELGSCVSFETPDETALYENASCHGDSARWYCDAGDLQYTNNISLYFPMTGATVIKRSEQITRLFSSGVNEQDARAKLKTLLAGLPKSVMVAEKCKR